MFLAAQEALDEVGEREDPALAKLCGNAAFADQLADIGIYLLSLCDLVDAPLDELISQRVDSYDGDGCGEAGVTMTLSSSKRHFDEYW